MNIRILCSSSVFFLGALMCSAPSSAKELRYATGFPPGAAPVEAAGTFSDIVEKETGGSLTVKVFTNALLGFSEISGGLRDGIADVGYVVTPYFPAEYPSVNLLNDASMQLTLFGEEITGREGIAYAGAMLEYIFFNCPRCNEEFAAQNQVFTGIAPTASYHLICSRPIVSAQDLKGKRLRAGAGQWNRWAENVGAIPVQMSGFESFEAMKQGIIDCTVISAVSGLADFGLLDVASDVTLNLPGGVFAGTPVANVNADVWRELDPGERTALLRGAAFMSASIPFNEHRREKEVFEAAISKGIVLHEPENDITEQTSQFIAEDLKQVASYYQENFGISESEQMLGDFNQVLERWVGLVQDIDSIDALTELYWTEVYSKLDVSRLGN